MFIHTDMIIKPSQQGVMIIAPHKHLDLDSCPNTVGKILDLPMNVYFMDNDSVIVALNETTAATCGFDSMQDALGSQITKAAEKESAVFSMQHDKAVMSIRDYRIEEEEFIRRVDGSIMNFISIKLPWYDTSSPDKILGIFGFTILPCAHGLAKSLAFVANSGLLDINCNQESYGRIVDNAYLSKQEIKCLKGIYYGYSMSNIAKLSHISVRTVEHYIDNIKVKLNVTSKHDLIEKAKLNGII